MRPTFRYRQVLTARDHNPREICGVGDFANRLPRVDGFSFPLTDADIVLKSGVPDSAGVRHLGRAGCLSLLHFASLRDALRGLDLARIGIYSSISPAPADTDHLGNISAVQIARFLAVTGPIYSFQDWGAERSTALDQALVELELNAVDAAIIVSSYALDDCLQNFYFSRQSKRLCEATACALLVTGDPSSPGTELGETSTPQDVSERELYFGTAEALVRLWSQRP